jgi:Holliday junction resolvasome RuvABC ATP-dependent DNA helicase subunit
LISGKSPEHYESEFSGIIGQNAVVNKLKFFINSSSSNICFPTLLFTGSHGLGKTYVAEKLAKSLGRRYVEVNCGTMENLDDFIEGVLMDKVLGTEPVTILLDEAHKLTSKISTVLLTLLAPKSNSISLLKLKDKTIEYDMSKINVIFGTTDAYLMPKPLLNRSLRVYFEHYNKNEMLQMLKLYLPNTKFDCDLDDLANACRGRGRDAFQLAQNISRYCLINKTNTIDAMAWDNIKSIFEIYTFGLNRQEVELLTIIKERQPISCANIAMSLMINEENVEGELEIRCRELGLINNTSKGRELSELGEEYVNAMELVEI